MAKAELEVQIMGSGRFDVSLIPDYIAESVGKATLCGVLEFLELPDGCARLEAKKAELRKSGLL